VVDHLLFIRFVITFALSKKKLQGDHFQVVGRSPGKVSNWGHVKQSCWSSECLQLKSCYLLLFKNVAAGDTLGLDFVSSLGRILKRISSLVLIVLICCVT